MAEGDTQLNEGQYCPQVDGLLAVFVGGDQSILSDESTAIRQAG